MSIQTTTWAASYRRLPLEGKEANDRNNTGGMGIPSQSSSKRSSASARRDFFHGDRGARGGGMGDVSICTHEWVSTNLSKFRSPSSQAARRGPCCKRGKLTSMPYRPSGTGVMTLDGESVCMASAHGDAESHLDSSATHRFSWWENLSPIDTDKPGQRVHDGCRASDDDSAMKRAFQTGFTPLRHRPPLLGFACSSFEFCSHPTRLCEHPYDGGSKDISNRREWVNPDCGCVETTCACKEPVFARGICGQICKRINLAPFCPVSDHPRPFALQARHSSWPTTFRSPTLCSTGSANIPI